MKRDLLLRGLSERTRKGYLREVRKLACYYKTSPDKLTEQQVGDYLLHLINRKLAPGSLRVAYSGIKFFYTYTEPRHWQVLRKLRLPKQKTLPSVLTIKEVHQIIAGTQQFHHAAFFWTLYTLGLRLEEGLNLQPGDIDATRKMVHIHRGKGWRLRRGKRPISSATGKYSLNSTDVLVDASESGATVSFTRAGSALCLQHDAADGRINRARLHETGCTETWFSKEHFSTYAATQYGFSSL